MTELDELLAAVRAAPGDDEPRLVLADRLIELGDPRGELIAVQCKLARGQASASVHELERTLLEQRMPPMGTAVTYDRGFVIAAKVEAYRGRDAIAFLAGEPLLRTLVIDGCGGGGDERWATVGAVIEATMDRLARLELENVIWYWYDSDWGDNRNYDREEIDETPQCAAMFALLPPRPPALKILVVPAHTSLPSQWRV